MVVEGGKSWFRGQMLMLADIKARSVSFPVVPVPFSAWARYESWGLSYSD